MNRAYVSPVFFLLPDSKLGRRVDGSEPASPPSRGPWRVRGAGAALNMGGPTKAHGWARREGGETWKRVEFDAQAAAGLARPLSGTKPDVWDVSPACRLPENFVGLCECLIVEISWHNFVMHV